MNHVSVSPTDGNGPTQGQRKTLTNVCLTEEQQPQTYCIEIFNCHIQVLGVGNRMGPSNTARCCAISVFS